MRINRFQKIHEELFDKQVKVKKENKDFEKFDEYNSAMEDQYREDHELSQEEWEERTFENI